VVKAAAEMFPQPGKEVDHRMWVKGSRLGSGSFGTVYKAFDRTSLKLCAIKEVPIESSSVKHRDRLDVELRLCQSLSHPNIVQCLGHSYNKDQSLYIYLEYVPGGSMACLLSEFGALQEAALGKASLDMLKGLDYLHTLSPPVVHRDLKGANLLVGLDLTVKLADFGCSKWSDDTKSFTTLGSVPWMAPEVITMVDGHGRKADIWSFGCTIIEMATAEKPWGNGAFDNLIFAFNRIANSSETPPLPGQLPSEWCDLIASCVQRSQASRPTTTELLQRQLMRSSRGKAGAQTGVLRVPSI